MQSVVLLYPTCCIYEIVILNYFLKVTGGDVVFVSMDGNPVTATEGYSMNVSARLTDIDAAQTKLMVIPGGDIREIDQEIVYEYLRKVRDKKGILAGICAGVDVLQHAGVLEGIVSTHSADLDVAVADQVITARANGYVDFAIETAKKLNLFEDEADLQETIAFWREFQRVE